MESVIIFDEQGRVIYPNTPSGFGAGIRELETKWTEASQLEYLRKDLMASAKRYEALAKEAINVHVAARALQAEARSSSKVRKRTCASGEMASKSALTWVNVQQIVLTLHKIRMTTFCRICDKRLSWAFP